MGASGITPGERSSASTPSQVPDVFVVKEGVQEGPYTTIGVCLLIRRGKLARDALYWRPGLTSARPISHFDDDVTVLLPRQHHYGFAYRELPQLFFTYPKFVIGMVHGDMHKLLLWAWDGAAKIYEDEGVDSVCGLTVERDRYDFSRTILLVTMPTPRRETEAYFTAAIVPDRISPTSPIRYFALSHFGGMGEGFPEAILREVTAEQNFCVKSTVEPLKDDFLNAIREACPPLAQPSKRSWFKKV